MQEAVGAYIKVWNHVTVTVLTPRRIPLASNVRCYKIPMQVTGGARMVRKTSMNH